MLHAIDERFDDLEQTKILAALVPQLHERLCVLEQMMSRMRPEIILFLARHGDFPAILVGNQLKTSDSSGKISQKDLWRLNVLLCCLYRIYTLLPVLVRRRSQIDGYQSPFEHQREKPWTVVDLRHRRL